MPAIAERRGRHAKHQHAIETAVALTTTTAAASSGSSSSGSSSSSAPESPHAVKLAMHAVPDDFRLLLESLLVELSRLDLMTLHQALCDPHAGPALCLLVQAVARAEGGPDSLCLQEEGPLMQGLVRRALCWGKPERCAEVVYAMAGEALSSRFLEAVLWHTPPQSVADPLFEVALRGRLVEFAEDEVANFVLQTWLQRTASPAHLKAALEELAPAMADLVRRRRAGVLWRLAGASARLGRHEKRVVKALLAALAPEDKAAGTAVKALLGSSLSSSSSGTTQPQQQELVLRVREEDGRLQLNVPGARLLECLMRMPAAKEVARPFCEAIAALPTPSLVALAKDNVGSRALLDPVLLFAAGAGGSNDQQQPQQQQGLGDALMGKLKGHYADLAGHPVGFHVLTRCFASCLALPGRRAVASELLAAESRLAGAHFGRRALAAVGVSLYRSNRGKWEEAMARGEKKRQVLEELFGMLEQGKEEGGGGGRGNEEKGKKKGKGQKKDPLMALLLGEGGEGASAPAATPAREGKGPAAAAAAAAGSLDFVLDTLKAGGGKKEKKRQRAEEDDEAESGGKGEGEGEAKSSSSSKSKRPHKGGREEGGQRRRDKATVRGGGKDRTERPQHQHGDGETPVAKAQRLLGNHALMTRSELLSAVGELEQEVVQVKKKSKQGKR